PPVSIILNDRLLPVDVPPQIMGGRTMVPMRAIFDALGAAVAWDQAARTATAQRGSRVVRLTVGDRTAQADGAPVTLDVPPVLVGGRVLVPLRFVSEAFGAHVQWDPAARTVTITSAGAAVDAGAGALPAGSFPAGASRSTARCRPRSAPWSGTGCRTPGEPSPTPWAYPRGSGLTRGSSCWAAATCTAGGWWKGAPLWPPRSALPPGPRDPPTATGSSWWPTPRSWTSWGPWPTNWATWRCTAWAWPKPCPSGCRRAWWSTWPGAWWRGSAGRRRAAATGPSSIRKCWTWPRPASWRTCSTT